VLFTEGHVFGILQIRVLRTAADKAGQHLFGMIRRTWLNELAGSGSRGMPSSKRSDRSKH
jgi:hypothetical protein